MDDLATMRGRGASVEGSVVRRLEWLGSVVSPLEIAELWVFPPLPEVDASAEFFLFTRYEDGERCGLYSARLLPENGAPARQIVVEHGSVPADRMPRLVGRLQRRLGEDHRPFHVVIGGQPDRWEELLSAQALENGADDLTPTAVPGAAPNGRNGRPGTLD